MHVWRHIDACVCAYATQPLADSFDERVRSFRMWSNPLLFICQSFNKCNIGNIFVFLLIANLHGKWLRS